MEVSELDGIDNVEEFQLINKLLGVLKQEPAHTPFSSDELLKQLQGRPSVAAYAKGQLQDDDDYSDYQSFIDGLENYKADEAGELKVNIEDSLYRFADIEAAIDRMHEYFGDKFSEYLKRHDISEAQDPQYVERLRDLLADNIIRMNKDNLDVKYIEQISNVLYDIDNGDTYLVDNGSLTSISSKGLADIFDTLSDRYLV